MNLDGRLVVLRDNLEGEVLHVGLNLRITELASNKTLSVEDSVGGVHGDLVLRGVSNETLAVGEGDVGGGGAVTLVVGDDFDTVVLPYTDAPIVEKKLDELRKQEKKVTYE